MIEKAKEFATRAHAGQKRKYTGEDYIVHPAEVAAIVASVTDDPKVIAAAWLHDVVEDTPVSLTDIERSFGYEVAYLVAQVTDVSHPEDGNRKIRKALDRDHLAQATPEGQTLKLADLISNTASIVARDPSFAKVYMREKKELLEVLTQGDRRLWDQAHALVGDFFR